MASAAMNAERRTRPAAASSRIVIKAQRVDGEAEGDTAQEAGREEGGLD